MKRKESRFDTGVSAEELEKILQSIDDNLAGRSGLRPTDANIRAKMNPYTLPAPAPMPDLFYTLTVIRNANAPYYVVSGSLPGRIIIKTFNFFIKIFGRKQAYYNNLTLDMLGALVSYINTLQQQNSSQVNMINELVSSMAQLENSVEELHMAQVPRQKTTHPRAKALEPKATPKRKKKSQSKQ